MFLGKLNQEEKANFLELVYKIANIDQNYADEEKELIDAYKIEMGLSEVTNKKNIHQLVDFFSRTSIEVQKIVWFELINLICADAVIADEEQDIINMINEKFQLPDRTLKKIEEAMIEWHTAFQKVCQATLSEE